ncbi:MAG: 4Fe-4S binding protein [Desulfobacterales bacterium]|nr:4Fe-4S binding protein [Desulfobacterales bacterium]
MIQCISIGILLVIPVGAYYGISFINGNFSSLRIMGFSMTMPLEGLEAIIGTKSGGYITILTSMVVPFLLIFILGPVFCSWICPQNTFSEIGDIAYRKLHKRKRWNPKNSVFFIIPFFSIIIVIVLDVIFQNTIFTIFHPAAIFARTCLSIIFLQVLCVDIVLIGIILLIEIFGIRRFWCRYVCPLGALLSLIGFKRFFKIKCLQENCTNCKSCVDFCPFGNDPRNFPIRCRNCGICVSKCTNGALVQKFDLSPFTGKK